MKEHKWKNRSYLFTYYIKNCYPKISLVLRKNQKNCLFEDVFGVAIMELSKCMQYFGDRKLALNLKFLFLKNICDQSFCVTQNVSKYIQKNKCSSKNVLECFDLSNLLLQYICMQKSPQSIKKVALRDNRSNNHLFQRPVLESLYTRILSSLSVHGMNVLLNSENLSLYINKLNSLLFDKVS